MTLRAALAPALICAWLVISAVLFSAVLTAFVVPADRVYTLLPPCEARVRGGSCFACGMTSGYVAIAAGDFHAANEANRGAVPLYAASVANFAVAFSYVAKKALTHLRRRGEKT